MPGMVGSDDHISVRDGRRRPLRRRHHEAGWWWAYCTNAQCMHHAAITSAPFITRWGPRRLARHAAPLGALLRLPR